ncbi:MAG TPA: elongation factor G, partial [bacterium]|nr:elongation factor G [bacterium]
EPQSETVWHQADRYSVPRLTFVNKLDRRGADFFNVVREMKDRLDAKPLPLVLPYGREENFNGVIDLVRRKLRIFGIDEKGEKFEEREIPEEYRDQVEEYRHKIVEVISETDDRLLEKYMNNQELSEEEMIAGIRKATLSLRCVPVLCGSALKNKGIQMLLDAVGYYLPNPLDVGSVKGKKTDSDAEEERFPDEKEPFSALAFKIVMDPYVGKLVYSRIYSGRVKKGDRILNVLKNKKERVSRILEMHANVRNDREDASAGEIVALVGLNLAHTGDTLTDMDHPLVLESINFPEPVISQAIEPKTKADQDKLGMALHKLSEEDPSFHVKTDPDTGQTIIMGMGELHLEILMDRLLKEFSVQANVGAPQVSYREAPLAAVVHEEKYIRQTGGHGQYAHVIIKVEPLPRGTGLFFENKISQGRIPREYIPSIERGIMETKEIGPLAGYPLTDLRVTLLDGSFHEVDS